MVGGGGGGGAGTMVRHQTDDTDLHFGRKVQTVGIQELVRHGRGRGGGGVWRSGQHQTDGTDLHFLFCSLVIGSYGLIL